ncbi:MAG TPA: response regulator [Candidatus Saccharimonadales bacterium]|nr:response regulator [Candidatus Saccharimonadales bacterium]
MASQHKILVVEDEEVLLGVLKDRLKNEGFDVITARDGEQGLKMALEHKPDLILLDILMPKMGGITMLKNLRATPAGKDTHVIILTNVSDSKLVHEALTYGVRDFLVKSDWVLSDLVTAIRKQIDGKVTL